jgi:hypothetical protein
MNIRHNEEAIQQGEPPKFSPSTVPMWLEIVKSAKESESFRALCDGFIEAHKDFITPAPDDFWVSLIIGTIPHQLQFSLTLYVLHTVKGEEKFIALVPWLASIFTAHDRGTLNIKEAFPRECLIANLLFSNSPIASND